MKQNNGKLVRIVAGGTLAAMITFSSMSAMAATNFNNSSTCSSPVCALSQVTGKTQDDIHGAQNNGKSNEQIASEAGKLTQYRQQMLDFKKEILAKLVNTGAITQKQADAVLAALKSADSSKTSARTQAEDKYSNSSLTAVLKTLVSKKTITQKQADAIKKAFAQADRDAAKATTQDQSVAITNVQSALASMVKAKSMTQAQADAVIKAIKAQANDSSITLTKLQTTLNTLVKAKTISSSLAARILDACD